jgi:hypothetical protein
MSAVTKYYIDGVGEITSKNFGKCVCSTAVHHSTHFLFIDLKYN